MRSVIGRPPSTGAIEEIESNPAAIAFPTCGPNTADAASMVLVPSFGRNRRLTGMSSVIECGGGNHPGDVAGVPSDSERASAITVVCLFLRHSVPLRPASACRARGKRLTYTQSRVC
jgi:hypothetical protein